MSRDPNLDFYSFSADAMKGQTEPSAPEQPAPTEPPPAPETVSAAKRTASRIGWGVLVMCLVWIAMTQIVGGVALVLEPAWAESNVFLALASSIPLYLLAMPACYLVLRGMPTAIPERRIAVGKRVFALLPCAIALMMGGNLLGNAVMSLISTVTGCDFSSSLEVSLGMPLWLSALMVVVLAPLLEELIFRKLLIDRLLPLGESAAVIVSALLFAVFHFNLYQFFYAGLLGALLAIVYLRTGSYGLCVSLHACINFFGGILPTVLMDLAHYDELLALTADPEATVETMMTFLSANGVGVVLLFAYLLLLYATAIVGAILLLVFRKHLTPARQDGELPPATRARALFLNPGMLTLLAFAVLFTILTLISSATPV